MPPRRATARQSRLNASRLQDRHDPEGSSENHHQHRKSNPSKLARLLLSPNRLHRAPGRAAGGKAGERAVLVQRERPHQLPKVRAPAPPRAARTKLTLMASSRRLPRILSQSAVSATQLPAIPLAATRTCKFSAAKASGCSWWSWAIRATRTSSSRKRLSVASDERVDCWPRG